MADVKGEEMLYKRESKLGVTTFTFQSRRYMFPSVIVKGDPRKAEADCVMLDVGLFCPHCSRAVSGKLSSTLRRVALTKSTSAENINQARVYGSPGSVPQAVPYGSLDRASLKSGRRGLLEERGVAFSVGHGSNPELALSEEPLCRHGAIPRPIPCLPTHHEHESTDGGREEDSLQPVTTRKTTQETVKSGMPPGYGTDRIDMNSMDRRSDYDSLGYSSVSQSLETSIRSDGDPYRKNSSSDYDSMDASATYTQRQQLKGQKTAQQLTGPTKQRNTKHQSLESLGMSPPNRPGPPKRHSDDATIFSDNGPKISRISPDSNSTGSSMSTVRQAGLVKRQFRDSRGEVYVSDSEQVEMADSGEEALIEELLHDEEITDSDSVGRDFLEGLSSSGDELDNYEQEIERVQKVISASLEKVANQTSEDFQFDEYLAYVPEKARPKSQDGVDLYTKEVTAILEGIGPENEASDDNNDRVGNISPDDMVESILDNLDTELYSGDVTLNRIFSVRSDMDGTIIKETPRRTKHKQKRRPVDSETIVEETVIDKTRHHGIEEVYMNRTIETLTASDDDIEPKSGGKYDDTEVDYICQLDITQERVFDQSQANDTPRAKEREWSPEDFFEQAVESLPIDSEEGLTDWTSDYETDRNDQFNRDKIKKDFNIKSESDQDDPRPAVVSSYSQDYLGVRAYQSRTSSCEAILNDSHHEESSMGTSFHDTGSEHSGSMDFLSSSECSGGENNISAIEHDADFKQIISETMNMTESLKTFHDRKEKLNHSPQNQNWPNSKDKDAILVHSEDEEHLRQEIQFNIIEKTIEGLGKENQHVQLENQTPHHHTSNIQSTELLNGTTQEAVCPPRSPTVQMPPMYARINKLPLDSNSEKDLPVEQTPLNRPGSPSTPDVAYDDVDLDLEMEFENNMRLCEEGLSSRERLEGEPDDPILLELLSVESATDRTRKQSSSSHHSEIDEFIPETPEDQPEVIQQAYEAAQFVAKLLEGEQIHHPCAHNEEVQETKQEAGEQETDIGTYEMRDQPPCNHVDVNWHTAVNEAQGADSDFEARGSLSRQQAQQFMRMMKEKHDKPQTETDTKEHKALSEKRDEDVIVKSEEVTTQECTIVLMWPKKKKGQKVRNDINPFREVHLHRVTKINDLDIEVIEGPTIDGVEYPSSEQALDKRQKVDRISKEMSLVKSLVANEIPMVCKTDDNDGCHSVRSAQTSEQSTIETPSGEVITVDKSEKFTHIVTMYDTETEQDVRPQLSEIHADIEADDKCPARAVPQPELVNENQRSEGSPPLSLRAAISTEEGELTESVSMVSSVACSVEDQGDGACPPASITGEINAENEKALEEDTEHEINDDVSDNTLYKIVRDLKAIINSQSDDIDPFEGYTPKGQAVPTVTVTQETNGQPVITSAPKASVGVKASERPEQREAAASQPEGTSFEHNVSANVYETAADVQCDNNESKIKQQVSTYATETSVLLSQSSKTEESARTVSVVSRSKVPNKKPTDVSTINIQQPLKLNVQQCKVESTTVNCNLPDIVEASRTVVSNPEVVSETNVIVDSLTDKILRKPLPDVSKVYSESVPSAEFRHSQSSVSDVAIYSDDYEYSSMEALVDEYETTESEDETVEETVSSVLNDIVTTVVDFHETSISSRENQGMINDKDDERTLEETKHVDTEQFTEDNTPVTPCIEDLSDVASEPQTGYLSDYSDFSGAEMASVSEQVETLIERTKRSKFREPDPTDRFGSPVPKGVNTPHLRPTETLGSDISAEETKVMGSENEMIQLTKEIREKIKCLLSSELEIEEEQYSLKKVELVDASTETLSNRASISPEIDQDRRAEYEANRQFLLSFTRGSPPQTISRQDEIRIDTMLLPTVQDSDPFLSPVYVPGVKDHTAFIEHQLQSPTYDMFSEEYENDISQMERVEWSELESSNPTVHGATTETDDELQNNREARNTRAAADASSSPDTTDGYNINREMRSKVVGVSSTTTTTTIKETSKDVFSTTKVESYFPGGYEADNVDDQGRKHDPAREGQASPNTQERSIYVVDVKKYFGSPTSQLSSSEYSSRSKSHEEIRNDMNEQYPVGSQDRLAADTSTLKDGAEE